MNYKVSKTLFKIIVIFLIFQILISINVNASSMNVGVEEIEELFTTEVLNTKVPHSSKINVDYMISVEDLFDISSSNSNVLIARGETDIAICYLSH